MNRTRVVFLFIIAIAVVIIFGALFVQFLGNLMDDGSSAESEEATPLPAGSVLVSIASSNTKQNWMDQVVEQFNTAGFETSAGNAIIAEVSHVTSGGSMNAILDGNLAPVAWSPGDPSWVEQMNTTWQQRTNQPINSEACQATIYAPLGFVMWRPMAEALGWPDTPIGWDTIVELAADPEGWASYGRPEWGEFRFGHTHPAYANSGLLSMTGFVHGVVDSEGQLTAAGSTQAGNVARQSCRMLTAVQPGASAAVRAFSAPAMYSNSRCGSSCTIRSRKLCADCPPGNSNIARSPSQLPAARIGRSPTEFQMAIGFTSPSLTTSSSARW